MITEKEYAFIPQSERNQRFGTPHGAQFLVAQLCNELGITHNHLLQTVIVLKCRSDALAKVTQAIVEMK